MNEVISNNGMCREDNTRRHGIAQRDWRSYTNCTWWSQLVMEGHEEDVWTQTCKTRSHLPAEGESSVPGWRDSNCRGLRWRQVWSQNRKGASATGACEPLKWSGTVTQEAWKPLIGFQQERHNLINTAKDHSGSSMKKTEYEWILQEPARKLC